MAMNMLKLNDDKTEFIIFGTHQQLKNIDHITIRIGGKNIVRIEHARNLGFFYGQALQKYYAHQQTFLFIVLSA